MRGGFDEADKIAGLRHARAAIASGTDDATALAVAAFVMGYLSKDYKTAMSAIERALSLNPSSAAAHYLGALIHASSGNFAAVTAHANRALRLSPFDPVAFVAHMALGQWRFTRRTMTRQCHTMPRRCKQIPATAGSISVRPWRWRLPVAWRKQARLSNNCWNSIRVFGAPGSSTTQQSEHSRLGSKKAHAYSACLNSSSTRTVECRRAACRRRAA